MQEEEHLRNEKIHMSELDHPFITKLIRTFKDAKNVRRIKAIFWALICSLSPSLFLQSYSIGSSAKEAENLWENIPVLPLYFFCSFSPRMQKITIKEKHRFWVSCSILASPLMLQVYLLQELTTGRELFLFMEKVGRLQEWEAAFYAGAVLLAYVFLIS